MIEKRYALTKYASIFLSLVSGYIQPLIFARFFAEREFALLTLLYGLAVYFAFCDGGISKPIYARLRRGYVQQELRTGEIEDITAFYMFLLLGLTGAACIATVGIGLCYKNPFPLFILILLGLILSFNVIISYYKNILNSLDEYILSEKLDIARKIINVVALLTLFLHHRFVVALGINVVGLLGVFCLLVWTIARRFSLNVRGCFALRWETTKRVCKSYFGDSKHYFAFSINETLIYNSGYILVPLFLEDVDVVQYGLWSRVYLGIATLVYAIGEIGLPGITRAYFSNDKRRTESYFLRILLYSIVAVIILLIGVCANIDTLFQYWVDGKYRFQSLAVLALVVWLVGNSIQHVSGSFLLAMGGQFGMMKKVSFYIMLYVVGVSIVMLWSTGSLGATLLAVSIGYFCGAVYYLRLCMLILKEEGIGRIQAVEC
jgi:O-antigen/teichoic acid export membrane protein